jgi:hypothetical protein
VTPATLIFEHPTPRAIAAHFASETGTAPDEGVLVALVNDEFLNDFKPNELPKMPLSSLGIQNQPEELLVPDSFVRGARLSMLFDGLGQSPDYAMEILLSQSRTSSFTSDLLADFVASLKEALGQDPSVFPANLKFDRPDTWDAGSPVIHLSVGAILHFCTLGAMLLHPDKFMSYQELQRDLVSITGHSLGFATAAVVCTGIENEQDLLDKSKLLVRYWIRFGVEIVKQIRFLPTYLNVLVLEHPNTVKEVIDKAAGLLQITVVNSPSSHVVTGEKDVLEPLLSELRKHAIVHALPMAFPVHCGPSHVESTSEQNSGLDLLLPADARRVCECISGEDGVACHDLQEAVLRSIYSPVDWPATLRAVDAMKPQQVIHVGSAEVSQWFAWTASEQFLCAPLRGRMLFEPVSPPQEFRTSVEQGDMDSKSTALSRRSSDDRVALVSRTYESVIGIKPLDTDTASSLRINSTSSFMLFRELRKQFPEASISMHDIISLDIVSLAALSAKKSDGDLGRDLGGTFQFLAGLRVLAALGVAVIHIFGGDGSGGVEIFVMSSGITAWWTYSKTPSTCFTRLRNEMLPLLPLYWITLAVQRFVTDQDVRKMATNALFIDWIYPPAFLSSSSGMYQAWYLPSHAVNVASFSGLAVLLSPEKISSGCPSCMREPVKLVMRVVSRVLIALSIIRCLICGMLEARGHVKPWKNFIMNFYVHEFPLSRVPTFFLGMLLGQKMEHDRSRQSALADKLLDMSVVVYAFVRTLPGGIALTWGMSTPFFVWQFLVLHHSSGKSIYYTFVSGPISAYLNLAFPLYITHVTVVAAFYSVAYYANTIVLQQPFGFKDVHTPSIFGLVLLIAYLAAAVEKWVVRQLSRFR